MAAQNYYSINVSDASGTGAGPWTATVMYKPTAASTPTAPGVTTGPLGATGSAAATQTAGDGTQAGFGNIGDALERALDFVLNDRALGN